MNPQKPVRPPHVVFPHSTPPPVQPGQRGKIKKGRSLIGAGCLLQGLGLICLLNALAYFLGFFYGDFGGLIGIPIEILLGLWLLIYGSRKAVWRECSLCGGKLAHARVRLCPHCRSNLSPG